MSTTVKVKMFGDFTIEYDGKVVDDNSNRARKVWSLLAYLIQNRERAIPQDELIDLVWGENERDSDPRGALKAIFYRVRTTLDKLGDSAGHNFIISRAGAYAWNNAFTVETDADEFEKLIKEAGAEEDVVTLSAGYRPVFRSLSCQDVDGSMGNSHECLLFESVHRDRSDRSPIP